MKCMRTGDAKLPVDSVLEEQGATDSVLEVQGAIELRRSSREKRPNVRLRDIPT